MLKSDQKDKLRKVINQSLDNAEEHWENEGYKLSESLEERGFVVNKSMDAEPSRIPGHEIVKDGETVIDEFVALVADMRDSSNHLMCALSNEVSNVSDLQRVFFETSALLPALELTISFQGGSVTEYLGDGVLALFRVDEEDKKASIYSAHDAAVNAIQDTRDIVNEILSYRYNLPSLDIGVGLAYSKALVTLTGLDGIKHPKAFGACVFHASKLSNARNQVLVDERMKALWPTSENGKLKFRHKRVKDAHGYVIAEAFNK
ncbi:adenylate/guanylate cyclase [Halomonas litopenaei]|nr:adenylate/guanylate cyclase [Halomonas litopenaei]